MAKQESLKKLKFYDIWSWIFWISLLLLFLAYFFLSDDLYSLISIVIVIPILMSMVVIGWGMLYHIVKRKAWIWLTFFIIFIFITGGIVVALLFYYIVMRKEFKKGKGFYN